MIYFVEAERVGLIKIGYTKTQPDHRFVGLQVGSPVKLARLALMKGERDEEYEVQLRFVKLRSHGEWFKATPELRAFIAENAKPWTKGMSSDEFWSDAMRQEFDRGIRMLDTVNLGGDFVWSPVSKSKATGRSRKRP